MPALLDDMTVDSDKKARFESHPLKHQIDSVEPKRKLVAQGFDGRGLETRAVSENKAPLAGISIPKSRQPAPVESRRFIGEQLQLAVPPVTQSVGGVPT